MLKGTATIELTDVKTGQKEVVKHDNLVTNAVNDLLTLNPDGYLWEASYDFATNMLPICPNAIGGILLYENALDEDPAKYYAPDTNPLVGYSSNDVNTGVDEKRGSMNRTESGKLEDGNGYRFVFDFETSQANGTISALGLTSKWGGISGYGSAQNNQSAVLNLREKEFTVDSASKKLEWLPSKYETIVGLDSDLKTGYYAYVSGQNQVAVGKVDLPLVNISIVGKVGPTSDAVKEPVILKTVTFGGKAMASSGYRYYNFMDGGDGYIWGFEHADGANGNSANTAVLNWIKISKEDFTFTEGTFTVNAALYGMGCMSNELQATLSEDLIGYSIIKDGYLYCVNYNRTGIVKINLSNPADAKEILHPNGTVVLPATYSYESSATAFNIIGDVVYFGNGYIVKDEITPISYANLNQIQNWSHTSRFPKGLCDGKAVSIKVGPYMVQHLAYGAAKVYRIISLITPYLATINNLDTPVTKTADKTMKITYILREE